MNWLKKNGNNTNQRKNSKRDEKKITSENAIDIVVGGAAAGSFICYTDYFTVGPKHYVNLSEPQT